MFNHHNLLSQRERSRVARLIISLTRFFLSIFTGLSLFAEPQRIVSTVPGLTEILFELGLGDRTVGVSEYCRFPAAALSKPKVGSFLQPNLEAITALRPDLVLIIKNPVRLKQRLEAIGLKVEELDLETLPGILSAIDRLGAETNRKVRAAEMRKKLEIRLAAVQAKVKQRRRVTFLVGRTPQRLEGMVAVGPKSYLDELMKFAGGDNIFADSPAMYPKVSIEQLLARDPEVIFEMGDSVHEGMEQGKYREDVLAVWAKMPMLKAVRGKKVFPLNDNIYVVPGPRFADAAERFYEMLHGGGSR
jgi:iron complex transport system substrate-binding protein